MSDLKQLCTWWCLGVHPPVHKSTIPVDVLGHEQVQLEQWGTRSASRGLIALSPQYDLFWCTTRKTPWQAIDGGVPTNVAYMWPFYQLICCHSLTLIQPCLISHSVQICNHAPVFQNKLSLCYLCSAVLPQPSPFPTWLFPKSFSHHFSIFCSNADTKNVW